MHFINLTKPSLHVQKYVMIPQKMTQINDCSVLCMWRGDLWGPLVPRIINSGILLNQKYIMHFCVNHIQFQSLEVVDRGSETQLQVTGNLNLLAQSRRG